MVFRRLSDSSWGMRWGKHGKGAVSRCGKPPLTFVFCSPNWTRTSNPSLSKWRSLMFAGVLFLQVTTTIGTTANSGERAGILAGWGTRWGTHPYVARLRYRSRMNVSASDQPVNPA